MAPEALKGRLQKKECDIWSLGIILYEFYHQKTPFRGKDEKAVLEKILKLNGVPKFNIDIPSEAKDLILKMLQMIPNKRIKMYELFNHPYFKKFKEASINKREKRRKSCEAVIISKKEESEPKPIYKFARTLTVIPRAQAKKKTKKDFFDEEEIMENFKLEDILKIKKKRRTIINRFKRVGELCKNANQASYLQYGKDSPRRYKPKKPLGLRKLHLSNTKEPDDDIISLTNKFLRKMSNPISTSKFFFNIS